MGKIKVMSNKSISVIIAGGGLGGLAAALRLNRIGVDVTVFEAVPEIRELGVGINIQPNGVKELSALGLATDCANIAAPIETLSYYNKLGQFVMSEPRGIAAGYHWNQYAFHRGRLQGALYRAVVAELGEDHVVTNHQLVGFKQSESGVTAHFSEHGGGEATFDCTADILIGADGIHSAVRQQLYPNQGSPVFAGQTMWRGVTNVPSFLDGKTMIMAGHKTMKVVAYPLNPEASNGRGVELNWVAEDTFFDEVPPPETWNSLADATEVAERFTNWHFPWLNVSEIIKNSSEIFAFPKVDRDPIPQWTFGRVTLLGDAAHPMHPAGSNAGTQAICDGRALAAAFMKNVSPVDALKTYEAERQPQMSDLVNTIRQDMGPETMLVLAEERAPDGFDKVEDVMSDEEIQSFGTSFRKLAGFDPETVNAVTAGLDVPPENG